MGTLNSRRGRSPPGFLENGTFELDLDKSVGCGQALGTEPGLRGQTVVCSSPILYPLLLWHRASHLASLCLFPHLTVLPTSLDLMMSSFSLDALSVLGIHEVLNPQRAVFLCLDPWGFLMPVRDKRRLQIWEMPNALVTRKFPEH